MDEWYSRLFRGDDLSLSSSAARLLPIRRLDCLSGY